VDQQERREFVRSHRTCVFGYNRRQDGPAMTVVYYVMNGDDELLISTMHARFKAQVVGGGRKVSVCVLDEKWPFTYVQVYGDAVIDRDAELAAVVLNQVLGLMAGEPVPAERWPQVKEMAQREDRVVIRVRPYATFATPPRHVYQMSDIDTLTHWTSNSMPW
jgi:nitroimidazol reductase NimA-like FMN-containing flavoprotein (pyridoxamine 5'-phosphate oxidase superfamily)